ncbi:MAG: DedA family protein [SAR324 cluster bacterium]|uniref:DedA family protein n=1 Tax=SAR324 cluster bacterium TaxID=2024889 RepID=A0A7X9ILI4_9DELT|nr:DedA family protein [SAR324 cluster bacterium]
MEYLLQFFDFFLNIDQHLDQLVLDYGHWSYVVLFIVIFCETGLVVTPILPGDSLLFAAGAIATRGSINVHFLAFVIFVAAVLGDATNYFIGSRLGLKVFDNPNSRIFKKEYLDKTQRFYDRYGGKTIIIARFVPIVRTFAPFLAGVGTMTYASFAFYNIIGAALWVAIVLYAGFFFGEMEIVKNNFSLIIIGIVFISVLPAIIEVTKTYWRKSEKEIL